MKGIFYCANKPLKRRISLPLPFSKVFKLKDIYKPLSPLIVFNYEFLKMIKPDFLRLSNKVCFIHFFKKDKDNLKLTKKYGFFDYFTDEDSKEEVIFKLQRAKKILEVKERISDLEKKILGKDRKIEKITLFDPSSECYNWRYFLSRAHQELSRARRHLYNISFMAVDIDNFQQIIAVYNIKIADIIVRELTDILKNSLRKEDIVTRWRNDEFFIILPYLQRDNVYKVAKRIKHNIASHKFKYKSLSLGIKISIGIVSFPEDNIFNTQDIIHALNRCLANAKTAGGDTIVLYSSSTPKVSFEEKKKEASVEELKTKIDKLNSLLTHELLEMIYGFARAIEAKDFYTGRHVEYTALVAEKIAKELKLPSSEIEDIKRAAILHDLGKVGIDEHILSKRGSLSKKEREIVKSHPWIAAEILREIRALRGAIPAILYHHEHYDGKGYPLGLKGEEIPLGARIVAIADVYQALVSDRPYRKSYSKVKAIEIIKKETGKQFDPNIARIFLKIIKSISVS
jgi:diguanylate cyclase (GGDEF)-like protein